MFPCSTCVVAFTSQAYLDKHKKYCRGGKQDPQCVMMATATDSSSVTVLTNVNPMMTQNLAPESSSRGTATNSREYLVAPFS